MYIVIENQGVADHRGWSKLGASTKNDSQIGQFGTGNKQALAWLCRNGLLPRIFLGRKELAVFTKEFNLRGKNFDEVCFRVGGKVIETGFTTDLGRHDWNDPWMCLREFVSNAIDEGGLHIGLVGDDAVHGSAECTRVYLPYAGALVEAYQGLNERFLQLAADRSDFTATGSDYAVKFLRKSGAGPARVYRKGVYVGQSSNLAGLWDYDSAEFRITDSRTLDVWDCKWRVERCLGGLPTDCLLRVVGAIIQRPTTWEASLEPTDNATPEQRGALAFQWPIVATAEDQFFCQHADRGGLRYTIVPKNWKSWMVKNGCQTVQDAVLANCTVDRVEPAPAHVVALAERIWARLVEVWSTFRPMPTVQVYYSDNGRTLGQQRGDCVLVNAKMVDSSDLPVVLVEELCHYLTGEGDLSAGFQEGLVRIIAGLLGVKNEA